MKKILFFTFIFAMLFGLVFTNGAYARGVGSTPPSTPPESFDDIPAEWERAGEEPLEERERGVIIDESGGWMKVVENNPLIEENSDELDFILFSEEFPAESGGWMKGIEEFPIDPEDHPVFGVYWKKFKVDESA